MQTLYFNPFVITELTASSDTWIFIRPSDAYRLSLSLYFVSFACSFIRNWRIHIYWEKEREKLLAGIAPWHTECYVNNGVYSDPYSDKLLLVLTFFWCTHTFHARFFPVSIRLFLRNRWERKNCRKLLCYLIRDSRERLCVLRNLTAQSLRWFMYIVFVSVYFIYIHNCHRENI